MGLRRTHQRLHNSCSRSKCQGFAVKKRNSSINDWEVEPVQMKKGPVDCFWVWEAQNWWRKKSLEVSRCRIGEVSVLDGPVSHMYLEGVQGKGRP